MKNKLINLKKEIKKKINKLDDFIKNYSKSSNSVEQMPTNLA